MKQQQIERRIQMKKLAALVLSAAMMLSLASCGEKPQTNAPDSSPSSSPSGSPSASQQEEQPAKTAFPEKDMKVIVPFSPGGAVDATCRLIAETVPAYMGGHKLIVENVAGGGALIGQTQAVNAAPDGYTMLALTTSFITNTIMNETTFAYNDMEPIAMYSFDAIALVVPADSPFKTLDDLISAGKEREVVLCTSGHSTTYHVAGLLMEREMGVKFKYVHNDGAPTQIAQLLGGHSECATMAYGEVKGQIDDGSLRILAMMGEERTLDDVPTFKECGYDLVFGPWRGFAVPLDTPAEVIDALDAGFAQTLQDSDLQEKMSAAGYPITYHDRAYFQDYIETEYANFSELLALLQTEG